MHLAVYLFLNLASDSMVSLSQCSSKRVWAWNTPILSSHALFGRQYPRIERVREKWGREGWENNAGWCITIPGMNSYDIAMWDIQSFSRYVCWTTQDISRTAIFFPPNSASEKSMEGTEHNCKNCSCLLYLISLSLQVKSSSSFDNSLKSQLSWATWWGSVS